MPCHLRTSSFQQLWVSRTLLCRCILCADKYKQGSPLLGRTAFQTSLQKHQVPICLIQEWECGSAIIICLWHCTGSLSINQTWGFAMTLGSKQKPNWSQLCFIFHRLLSKVANHFELLVASTNDTLYWQDPLYSSKRRKCNFLSTRKTRSNFE